MQERVPFCIPVGYIDCEECIIGITAGSVLGTEKKFCKIKLSRGYRGKKGEDISLGRIQDTACAHFSTEDERDALSYQIGIQKLLAKTKHEMKSLALGLQLL